MSDPKTELSPAAGLAADLLLELVGGDPEQAGKLLDAAAARRANLAADLAEAAKFGLLPSLP